MSDTQSHKAWRTMSRGLDAFPRFMWQLDLVPMPMTSNRVLCLDTSFLVMQYQYDLSKLF